MPSLQYHSPWSLYFFLNSQFDWNPKTHYQFWHIFETANKFLALLIQSNCSSSDLPHHPQRKNRLWEENGRKANSKKSGTPLQWHLKWIFVCQASCLFLITVKANAIQHLGRGYRNSEVIEWYHSFIVIVKSPVRHQDSMNIVWGGREGELAEKLFRSEHACATP